MTGSVIIAIGHSGPASRTLQPLEGLLSVHNDHAQLRVIGPLVDDDSLDTQIAVLFFLGDHFAQSSLERLEVFV